MSTGLNKTGGKLREQRETFSIYHPERGEKLCDELCWPMFEKQGWSKSKDAPAPAPAPADESDSSDGSESDSDESLVDSDEDLES